MSHDSSGSSFNPVSDTSIIRPSLSQRAKDFAASSRAPNTLRGYRSDIGSFSKYCHDRLHTSVPALPETVADYISWLAITKKPSTIARHLASISVCHKMAGFTTPVSSEIVKLTMAGIRRTLGVSQNQKAPIRIREIRAIVSEMGTDLHSLRDRAILLVCYAGALRRSELVALDVVDVSFVDEGALLTLRQSKTDQDRRGVEVAIMRGSSQSTCPVRALQDWLTAAEIIEGPVFRPIVGTSKVGQDRLAPQGVCRIIKRLAALVGMKPDSVGAHSTRAGMITDAFATGIAQAIIARHSRHRSASINAYVRGEIQTEPQRSGGIVITRSRY